MSYDNSSVASDSEMGNIAESHVARNKNRAVSLSVVENFVVRFSSQAAIANIHDLITFVSENQRLGPRHIFVHQKLRHAVPSL